MLFACVRAGAVRAVPRCVPIRPVARMLHTTPLRMEKSHSAVAQYVGPMRMAYYRLKLFSLSSLSVAALFAPVFLLWPHKMELAARVGIVATTLGASSVSTALISWIGSPYVGHMTLRRADPHAEPLHYISDSIKDTVLDDTPSDPTRHASEKYYMEIATLSWHMRSLKTTVYAPSLLRAASRPLATWELPETPPPITIDAPASVGDHTISSLVAETVDVSSGRVVGRWWARWRITGVDSSEPVAFEGSCESEGKPVRYFYVDETQLGEAWRVLD